MVRLVSHPSSQILLQHALAEITGLTERWPDRRVILIVPEASKADVERQYLERTQAGGLLMAEVLSFRRLAFRLFAAAGGLAVKRLTSTGRAVLIGKVLLSGQAQFRRFGRLRQKPGFAVQLSAMLEEFSRYLVTADALETAADTAGLPREKERFADLALLWQQVEAARHEAGFVDSAADTDRLIRLLLDNRDPALAFLSDTDVYVAGFGELTPFSGSESAVIRALAERVRQVTVLLPAGPGRSFLHARRSRLSLQRAVPCEETALDVQLPERSPRHEFVFSESGEDEARAVAGEIRRLLRETDLTRRDIAVGLCRPEDSAVLADVLRAFEVPSFMDEASDIRWTPFSRYMTALLAISQKQDRLDDLMRLLGNPLSGILPDMADGFENTCLAAGLKRLPAILNQVKQPEFAPCIALLHEAGQLGAELRKTRSGEAKVHVLLRYLAAHPVLFDRIEAELADAQAGGFQLQATALARAVNEWQERLEETAGILGPQMISQAHFCQLLSESILRLDVKQIPAGIDRVRVAPLRYIVNYPAKVLFVTGVSARHYPQGDLPGTFLTTEERRLLSDVTDGAFPNGSDDHRLTAAALDRKVRQLPERTLYFSTPDGAGAILPPELDLNKNWAIRRIKPGQPNIHWNHPTEAARRLQLLSGRERTAGWPQIWQKALEQALGHPFTVPAAAKDTGAAEAVISQEALHTALERRPVTSVSRIQDYNLCPYKFYAAALLGLQERDLGMPDPAVQGSFMHDVLKASLDDLMMRLSGVPAERAPAVIQSWRAWLRERGQADIETLLSSAGRARSLNFPGNDLRVMARLSPAIEANLDRIAHLYAARGARPVALEYRFSASDPEAIELEVSNVRYRFSGIIDRVDRYPDGTDVLIDYKRKDRRFDAAAFEAGTDIQLPFYENAWQKLNPSATVRGFYYHALNEHMLNRSVGFQPTQDDPGQHMCEVDRRLETDAGLAGRALEIAADTIARIGTGRIPAAPCIVKKSQIPCRYCAFRVTCRLDGLSEAAAQDRGDEA